MSQKTNDGNFAFPFQYSTEDNGQVTARVHPGMSLRDYFAAKAMQGLLSNAHAVELWGADPNMVASSAYEYADAMLDAREEGAAQ